MIIYRVQDKEGRGPWRPGLSRHWVRERDDHANLRTWMQEFGDVIPLGGLPFGMHFGCACKTLDQLRRWFSADEYETLLSFGFEAVQMEVDRVLAESETQLVFQRSRPLRAGVEPVSLYGHNAKFRRGEALACNVGLAGTVPPAPTFDKEKTA